nr:hypothetical protein [Tanacetum cinerariifolium]
MNADGQTPVESQFVNDSDEDVDEYITMEEPSKAYNKNQGASTPTEMPWCLLGDFNAPLCMEDTSMGSSSLDVTMREFRDCVENMKVMDVQRTGMQYTWNQKPKGKDGILRKLDRVLANLEFLDVFMGAHAVFKPYRISDHSPAMAYISGFFMFRVVKKLNGLKKPICKLMYDKGNLHANVIRLRKELDKVQTDLDSDPSNFNLREKEAVTVADFNEALLMEEKFLKQKAKITWLKEGDSNTAYFHKVVKSRVSQSRIDVVTDAYGNVHQSTEVAKAFIDHYEIFLRQPGNTSDFNTDNLFLTTLDESEAFNMVRDISSQEVKSAMFSMGNDKSPGPDGFTAAFFKDTWDIIGVDVIKAVKEFFLLMADCSRSLTTPLLLLFLSKTIANRLKSSLKRLISPNQSAFVPGRCISDNILLTQEIMHNYHLDHGVPRCAFKVDIQKAYDTVDWDFLRVTLIGFGFHERIIAWIMECVTTTSFCISINGSLHGYSEGKRGLRQAKVIKDTLDEFKDASSLNPSMPKSKAYFCNVINNTKLAILNIFPFEEDRLPVKYLGVPLGSSRLISRDCKELIDKVQNRVNDWKNKSLSIAGRLQLIQSVLSSMHVYWDSVFMLPSRVLLDIEQIMCGFLWSQDNTSRGKVKVAWDVVCLPKQEGGLGIRRLDHFNKALMVLHVWKLLFLQESLWVKWIHVYKLKNRSFWDIPYHGKMSWSWRKLLLLRPLIQEFIWSCIGDGRTTFTWFDKWCDVGPLSNIISSRDITRAGFNHAFKVHDYGMGKPFSVYNVWDSIHPRDNLVPWCDLVWFHACILRHAFNMWLILKQRLRTQDCLRSWEVNFDLTVVCPLCETHPDSHEHLFFDCPFSQQVWSRVQQNAGLTGAGPSLATIITYLLAIAKRKSSMSCIGKLVVAAAAYFIWHERNSRLFNKVKRSVTEVVDCILSNVRLKFLSCRFKKSRDAIMFARLWEIPISNLK